MTNVEYIFEFANKHNFPKSECEVLFNAVDDGSGNDIHTTDDDIVSVRFDKSLVKNEIKIDDIRFDIDSDLPNDVFIKWQEDNPDMSLIMWVSQGKYFPDITKNNNYFNELESITKEIEMKLDSLFSYFVGGDSDYDEYDDSDYEEDDED